MTDITAADIRANRPAPVAFDVPGWGGTVYIRKVPLSRRLSLAALYEGDTVALTGDDVISIVVECVVDASGSPLFEPDDAVWLDAEFADEVTAVFGAVMEAAGVLSGEALEEAEGN